MKEIIYLNDGEVISLLLYLFILLSNPIIGNNLPFITAMFYDCARVALILYKPTFRSLFKIFKQKAH